MKNYILFCTLCSISFLFSTQDSNLLAHADYATAQIEITSNRDPFMCTGDSITLTLETALVPDSLVWKWAGNVIEDPTAFEITLAPEAGLTIVSVELYVDGELFEDSFSIETDPFIFPDLTTRDTTICQGESFALAGGIMENTTSYQWQPDTFYLSDPQVANPIANPPVDVTYVITATSMREYCTETDSVIVTVLPNEVEIMLPDTTGVCDDDPQITLSTSFQPSGSLFQWRPNNGSLSDINVSSPTATLDFSTRYIVTMTTPQGCVSIDTVVVRLDSLPEFDYAVVPDPNPDCNKYCPGEFVTIFSNPANPERFPDINYTWTPLDGSIQDSNYFQNISIETTVAQYYIRRNLNNGCDASDSIWIDVVDPDIPINITDTVVCANKPVQIEIDPTDLTEIQWSPEQGLSCTDCPNPVATVGETTTFTVTAIKELCCPVSTSVTINVIYPPIPIDPVIACPGEAVQILVDSEGFTDPTWVSNTDQLSCTDCFNPFAVVGTDTNFELQAFDEDGCLSVGMASVGVFPQPDLLEINVEPGTEIPIGTVGTFMLNTSPQVDAADIVWFYNGDEVDSGVRTTAISILEEGEANIIEVFFTDINGCARSLEIVISGIEPIFEVPNVFTPGGQNMVNQFFRPLVVNAEQFDGSFVTDFKVFSRWGQKVYDNDNNEQGWDGRQGGSPAPADVYVYVIEITLPNGSTRRLKGDVTLLR